MARVSNFRYGILLDRNDFAPSHQPTTRELMASSWSMTSPKHHLSMTLKIIGSPRHTTTVIRASKCSFWETNAMPSEQSTQK